MTPQQHATSKLTQFILVAVLSVLLGVVIPFKPMVVVLIVAPLLLLVYLQLVLANPHLLLRMVILVIPFNFESLIAAINIQYVNPFNIFWLSYVGIVALQAVHHKEPILVRSPLNAPLFFLMLFSLIALVQAKWVVPAANFQHHVFPTYQQWIQWLLFYFVCLKGIRSEKEARTVILWIMGMVFVAGTYNIREYVGMVALSNGDQIVRAAGLFSNPNYSSGFFTIYTPVAIGLALANMEKAYWQTFFMALVSIIGIISAVLTYSRGGIIALGFVAVLIALFSKLNMRLVLIILIGLGIAAIDGTIMKRFGQTTVKGPYGDSLDVSTGARLMAWSKAFELIKQRPIIGHGYYTFRYIKVEKWDEAARAVHHGNYNMAVHNGFLNVLVNAGMVGFLTFAWFIGAASKLCFDVYRKSPPGSFWRAAGLGILGGFITLLISNLSDTRLYDRQLVGYLWILLAALQRGVYYSQRPAHPTQRFDIVS